MIQYFDNRIWQNKPDKILTLLLDYPLALKISMKIPWGQLPLSCSQPLTRDISSPPPLTGSPPHCHSFQYSPPRPPPHLPSGEPENPLGCLCLWLCDTSMRCLCVKAKIFPFRTQLLRGSNKFFKSLYMH